MNPPWTGYDCGQGCPAPHATLQSPPGPRTGCDAIAMGSDARAAATARSGDHAAASAHAEASASSPSGRLRREAGAPGGLRGRDCVRYPEQLRGSDQNQRQDDEGARQVRPEQGPPKIPPIHVRADGATEQDPGA